MKRLAVFLLACGITTLVGFASCRNQTIAPVAIDANDMCAFCRMTISEKRYAAELIDKDGEVSKFDDIGCMTNFMKQRTNEGSIRATFVMDFERGEWLKAEDAIYVRSPQFKTPMSGGIAAFKHESTAQATAAKYQGTVLRFAELVK